MLVSLVYLVIRVLLRLLVPNGQDGAAKDLEIVVLRHQLQVEGYKKSVMLQAAS